MLVLGRRFGESLVFKIGGVEFRVKVDEHHAFGQVKVSIDAPKEVLVLREELVRDAK